MWLVTGSVEFGAAFGIIELVWKPIQYFIHERIWYKFIKYGVTKQEPVKSDSSLMDSISTTGPKRLIYTKKTE